MLAGRVRIYIAACARVLLLPPLSPGPIPMYTERACWSAQQIDDACVNLLTENKER